MTSSRIRLLVAEDHPLARAGLVMVLERNEEFEIVGEAEDGPTAVELTLKLTPDVVLMDLMMPGFDGIEATRQIKSARPQIKVLVITSYERDDHVYAALAAGADGYCLKNVRAEQVMNAVKAVAAGAAWLDAAIAERVLRSGFGVPAEPAAVSPDSHADTGQDKPHSLSRREEEVLRLVVEGLSNQEIAERLVLSPETVKTHMRHIMEKLSVSDRTQAAVKAMRQGLI